MRALRNFLRDHRRTAALLVALALLVKALVPAGYMIGQQARVLTIEVCADTQGAKVTRQIVVPHSAAPGESGGAHAKSAEPCAYSGLAMAGLEGADPVLLALALAFIIALGFAPQRSGIVRQGDHIRPPLRGPPAFA